MGDSIAWGGMQGGPRGFVQREAEYGDGGEGEGGVGGGERHAVHLNTADLKCTLFIVGGIT